MKKTEKSLEQHKMTDLKFLPHKVYFTITPFADLSQQTFSILG